MTAAGAFWLVLALGGGLLAIVLPLMLAGTGMVRPAMGIAAGAAALGIVAAALVPGAPLTGDGGRPADDPAVVGGLVVALGMVIAAIGTGVVEGQRRRGVLDPRGVGVAAGVIGATWAIAAATLLLLVAG